jgi:hypothetical protein
MSLKTNFSSFSTGFNRGQQKPFDIGEAVGGVFLFPLSPSLPLPLSCLVRGIFVSGC